MKTVRSIESDFCLTRRALFSRPRKQRVEEAIRVTSPSGSMVPRAMETISVSEKTLQNTKGRMFKFLNAATQVVGIRTSLESMGFTREDLAAGWKLLHRASGYQALEEEVFDTAAVDATTALDAWRSRHHTVLDATLRHFHPDAHALLFRAPTLSRSDAVVVYISRLLERLDELESSDQRGSSRASDRAALDRLVKRGIDSDARATLRTQLAAAEGRLLSDSDAQDIAEEARALQYLYAARAWYEEATAVARQTVTRRDHLIRLGLASRKVTGKEQEDGDEDGEDGDGRSVAKTIVKSGAVLNAVKEAAPEEAARVEAAPEVAVHAAE